MHFVAGAVNMITTKDNLAREIRFIAFSMHKQESFRIQFPEFPGSIDIKDCNLEVPFWTSGM